MSDSATATGIGHDPAAVAALLGLHEVTGDVPAEGDTPAEPPELTRKPALRVLDTLPDEGEGEVVEGEGGEPEAAPPAEPPADPFADIKQLVAAQSAQISQLISALSAKPAAPPPPPAPPKDFTLSDEEYAAAFDSKEGLAKLLARVRQDALDEAQGEVPKIVQRRELEAQQLDARVTEWTQKPEHAKYISKDSPYQRAFSTFVKRLNDANAWDVTQVETQLDTVAKAVEEYAALFQGVHTPDAPATPAAGSGVARPKPTTMGGSKRETTPAKPTEQERVRKLLGLPPV